MKRLRAPISHPLPTAGDSLLGPVRRMPVVSRGVAVKGVRHIELNRISQQSMSRNVMSVCCDAIAIPAAAGESAGYYATIDCAQKVFNHAR